MDAISGTNLTNAQFFLLLSFALFIVQAVYRIWDKRDNRALIAEIQKSNQIVMDAFAVHSERGRRTQGLLTELKAMHDVRDDDGRFMWYMPKEIISTQKELVKLMGTIASSQEVLARLFEQKTEEFKTLAATQRELCRDSVAGIKETIRK